MKVLTVGGHKALPREEEVCRESLAQRAPFARACHPREDHLVPLFVALGTAGAEPAKRIYHDVDLVGGVTASSYRFG